MNILPGAPDITGGGGCDETALWCTNEQEVVKNLERTFETCFLQSYTKDVCKPMSEGSLMDFQQFRRETQSDRPSAFTYMLQCHGSNMDYVLEWAICQLMQLCKAKPTFDSEGNKAWTAWCFCRMVAPVLGIFLSDPVVSTSAKENIHKSLEAACSDAAGFFKPIAAVLGSLLSVAKDAPVATPKQFHSTLTKLQQCRYDPTCDLASLLHRLIAMLHYFKFHKRLPSLKLVESSCIAIFPVSLSSSLSIEELATPAMKGLPLELVLEYGSLLIDCLVQSGATVSCLMDMSIKLLGSASCLKGNESLHMYHNWVGKRILQLLQTPEDDLSPGANELLPSEARKLSRMVQAHLAHSMSSAVVKTWPWNLMELICLATKDGQEALTVLNEIMTQDVFRLLGSAILDINQAEAIRNSILPVLVSLFSALPPNGAQKLFMNLSEAYPQPLEWVEAERLAESTFSMVSKRTYGVPQPKYESVFPYLADLKDSSKAIKAGTCEDKEKLRLRRHKLSSAVSESHVDFLKSVADLVHAKGGKALLAFQLALLCIQANNCRSGKYNEKNVFPEYEINYYGMHRKCYPTRDRILLEDADRAIAIRHLQHVWRYTLKPSGAIHFAAKIVPESGTCRDTSDFVLSLIELLPHYLSELKVAFGVLAQGTPEQLIDGVSQLLLSSYHGKDVRHLCLFLESLGSMYNKIKEDAAATQWLPRLQELARRIVDLLTSQEDSLHYLNVGLVAQVICDAGSDAVLQVASLLQQRAYSTFPDMVMILCARFNDIPMSSVNKDLLLQPPFQSFLVPICESKKAAALSAISRNPHDASLVDDTIRKFRSFTQQMGMAAEFTAFAREVADLCPYNVRRMIEKRYI